MSNQPRVCTIHAPGKVNLHLEIGDLRSDGFHDIKSIFAGLEFGDDLRFEITEEKGFWELLAGNSGFPAEFYGKDNLVTRAVSLFGEKTGFDQGIRCTLTKKIPPGAGLGGGSSDAASALMALNCLCGTGLPMDRLAEMAACLGSDVPYFLHGGTAYAGGRGEFIEELPALAEYRVLLVIPGFQSSTAEAYRLLDQSRNGAWHHFGRRQTESGLKNSLKMPAGEWPFFNDFLPVLPQSDVYRTIINELLENGADFAGLSGSGSCCYGVFADRERAGRAEKNLIASEKLIKNIKIHQNYIHNTFFLASGADPVLQ